MLQQPPIVLARASVLKAINYLLLEEDLEVGNCMKLLKRCDEEMALLSKRE